MAWECGCSGIGVEGCLREGKCTEAGELDKWEQEARQAEEMWRASRPRGGIPT